MLTTTRGPGSVKRMVRRLILPVHCQKNYSPHGAVHQVEKMDAPCLITQKQVAERGHENGRVDHRHKMPPIREQRLGRELSCAPSNAIFFRWRSGHAIGRETGVI